MTGRSSIAARVSWCWCQDYLLPALVTLLAMALYLHGLDSKSLWYDELGTLSNVGWNDGWLAAIRNSLIVPVVPKPPLFFVVSRLFFELSDSVFVLRLLSVFFATVTVPLVYALGRSFFGRKVGLAGAYMLAIAPFFIRYAQEARMYAMLVFLSTLSLYLFWQAIRSDRWGWWLAFVVATAASLYTHQFALLPLGAMTLFTLWLLIRPGTRSRFPFRGWHFFAALAAILLLLVPMTPFLVEGLKSGRGLGGSAVPRWSLAHMVGALRLFSGGSNAGAVIHTSLFLLTVVVLAIKRRDLLALAVMWIGIPFAIVLVVPFGHTVRLRYFIFVLPVYLLLVAYGLWVTIRWLASRFTALPSRPHLRSAAVVLATATLLVMLAGIIGPSIASYYAETKQNWRDAAWLVHTLAEPGDKVLVRHLFHRTGLLYYASQWDQNEEVLTEQSVQLFPQDLATAFPLAEKANHWLVVPYGEEYLPGGALDMELQPFHHLSLPVDSPPAVQPEDREILGPVTFRRIAVVQVVATNPPAIDFWAEEDTISTGACTWLGWNVENVREVYLNGEGVMGHDQRKVCPTATTRYDLRVIHQDGSVTLQTIEIRLE